MAIRTPRQTSDVLSYEQYLAEGEIPLRYDIVEGVRIYMPGPTWRHQRIQAHVSHLLYRFKERSRSGLTVTAPFDILIRRTPRLQTRQPDVLFVTHGTLARGGGIPDNGPLSIGPELVVEILSESERESMVNEKLADYAAIGVREVWLIHPEERTVEVLRLTSEGPVVVATYTETQSFASLTFPDLTVSVAGIFQS